MRGDVAEGFGLAGYGTGGREYVGRVTEAVDGEDLDWHLVAACRPEMKPDTITLAAWVAQWYPHDGQLATAATAICAGCPVRDLCLAAGMDEKFGRWGDTSERERQRLRKKNRTGGGSVRKPISHGTPGGYRAHLRRGEKPCEACRHGHADAQVVRNARARRAARLAEGAA